MNGLVKFYEHHLTQNQISCLEDLEELSYITTIEHPPYLIVKLLGHQILDNGLRSVCKNFIYEKLMEELDEDGLEELFDDE